ncbi:MAG TPA: arginine--tRNA ligase [Acholeplasmataceae bacterium]|nr:arginine--tRNA ligase [Acholeplasmataceae bacterium]HQC30893.1 arginine--tRNA ligase [Acholeplasmataceae bacterium]
MLDLVKVELKEKILTNLNYEVDIEIPRRGDYDLAIPLFRLLKSTNLKLPFLYEQINNVIITHPHVKSTELIGAFLNIKLNSQSFSKSVLTTVYKLEDRFGEEPTNNEVVVIDYSSPNIAKNFSVGHLRSTVIGHSLKLIFQKLGYTVVGINHLGDWGTQFGKLLVAYDLWGNEEKLKEAPIDELQRIYIKFHEVAENKPELEDEARQAFKELEEGDKEKLKLWTYFKDESLKEFMKVYDLLNVHFDSYAGEAFYNDKIDHVIDVLNSKNLLKIDDGATIIDLGDDIPPALIKRSDGATLYMTRDLAALLYRYETYNMNKTLYLVGNEQKLHFEQLKRIVELLELPIEVVHVNFGLVLIDGKKMSTRSGTNANLHDVLLESISDAKAAIMEKNPTLESIDEASRAIGVGAVVFNDLKNDRNLNIDFNLENMLRFEGQTGPYLQYTSVRINSILKETNLDINQVDYSLFENPSYFDLVKQISTFSEAIKKAAEEYNPSVISKHLLVLAQLFNSFYGQNRILVDDVATLNTNLLLISNVRTVINEGLRLLGIKYLDEM